MPNNEERNEYVEEPSPVTPENGAAPSPEAPVQPVAEEKPAEQPRPSTAKDTYTNKIT